MTSTGTEGVPERARAPHRPALPAGDTILETDFECDGVIAAPTAALPEWTGGVRNWDYRFCGLRYAILHHSVA